MSNFTLAPEEQQALQEFASLVAEESAVVMSTLLDKKIEIEAKIQEDAGANADELSSSFPEEMVVVQCPFASGFEADLNFMIGKPLVAKLSDLMMMGDGSAEFNEDHIDAIQEGVNQMMGATASSLTAKTGKTVDFQPSTARLAEVADSGIEFDDMTLAMLTLEIEGASEGDMAMMIPYSVIQEAAASLGGGAAEGADSDAPGMAGDLDMDLAGMDAGGGEDADMGEDMGGGGGGGSIAMPQMVNIGDRERERLELLMDIRLDVSIELGRTTMLVRDILELGPGSVIELDKMAGETVDLLINNKKLAEGEVVVVDENFGVRITHLISMEERIKMLQTS